MLGSNAHEKTKATSDPPGMIQTPVEAAVAQGAGIGLAIGLVLFIIVYNWPTTITFIPGIRPLMGLNLHFADWLVGFRIVRVLLGFTLLAYVVNFGFMVLIGGALLLGAAWSGLKRLLEPRATA